MASGSKKADNAAEIDRLAVALAKEPRSRAFIPLAEEYGKAGMWEEAVAVLEDGLKIYPGFITAMVALGRAYEQLNQSVKAQVVLEEAIKLSPDNLRAHRTLAKLYAAKGARDEAIQSCNVILALNPQDQEALSLRAGLETLPVSSSTDADTSGQVQAKSPVVPRERLTETVDSTGPRSMRASSGRASVVHRLEQWLNSVQKRRRDPERFSRPSSNPSS